MRFGIVVFPGSNCDEDAYHAVRGVFGFDADYIWHKDTDLKGADVLILPGGFAHGDYLRTGAMARFSPVMNEVRRFADRGGPVLGICNGFQILLEAGLLPASTCICEWNRRTRCSPAPRRPVRSCISRSGTAKATTSRRRRCWRNSRPIGRWCSAMPIPPAALRTTLRPAQGRPERRRGTTLRQARGIPTDRSMRLPRCATNPATWSA